MDTWCDRSGLSWLDDDCDDTAEGTHPEAFEDCDGLDNDCYGLVDDNTWCADADGDGFGDDALLVTDCEPPEGWVAVGTDCDDARADVSMGAVEVDGDAVDNDRDGRVDTPYAYVDEDGDGYGEGDARGAAGREEQGQEKGRSLHADSAREVLSFLAAYQERVEDAPAGHA